MKKEATTTETTESAAEGSEKMHLHPITLAFRRELSHLEQPFLDDYFTGSLFIFRFACFVGFLIYGLFGILDAYLVPEQKNIFWLFRYAFFCPLSLGIFLFTFSPLFKRVMQPLIACWGIVAGGGIIMMILLAPPPASFSYYAGLILVFMMAYTVVRLRFIWATFTCWLIVFLYEFAAVSLAETPIPILINNNFFFIGANLIGMVACYGIEYYARRDFYLKILLQEEREHVRRARNMLENRVEERTAQLQETNVLLKKEMKERAKAEEEHKQMQEQLVRHQKMESLGLMAGGVAHDLNNILSGIISYPELLLLNLPEDSNMRIPLEEILQSGERAAAVVADLLTVARGVASQHEVTSLNELVTEYLASPECKAQQSLYPKIVLQVNLEDTLPNCKCSTVHIQKVVMNLVNNAFEAIEKSGTIVLSTTSQHIGIDNSDKILLDGGDYVLVRVSDSGSGIPDNTLQHIFEPFYSKKVMGRSGTGLGLAVVWNTVLEHKGTVNVTSSEQGTTFTVYLPVSTELKPEASEVEKEDLRGAATVLVVDDVRIQRDITNRILTGLGYEVYTVESGESAVEYLENHAFDLILLDMLMEPGMNGRQTYEVISRLYPGQKALIASGFSENDDVQETLRLGACGFLKKPFSIDQLGHAVKQALQ